MSDLLKPCTVWEVHVADCFVWGGEIPENFQAGPDDTWACVQPLENPGGPDMENATTLTGPALPLANQ